MLCQRLAPSMRAAGMVDEFRDRDEAHYVIGAAASRSSTTSSPRPATSTWRRRASASPCSSRARRSARWPICSGCARGCGASTRCCARSSAAMGINVVPLPVEGSARAYDEGKVDSFVGLPSAALAFQWSTQARYVMDLRVGYLTGCMLVVARARGTRIVARRSAGSSRAPRPSCRCACRRRRGRWTSRSSSGLFAKQGLQTVPVPAALQAEFDAAAREAQKQVREAGAAGDARARGGVAREYRASHTATPVTRRLSSPRAVCRRRRRCRVGARRADRAALRHRRARRHGVGAHRQADRPRRWPTATGGQVDRASGTSTASPATSCRCSRACARISSTASSPAACSARSCRRRCACCAWSASSRRATSRRYVAGRLKPLFDEELPQGGLRQPGRRRHRARSRLLARADPHAWRAAARAAVDLGPRRGLRAPPGRCSACTWCRCRSTRPTAPTRTIASTASSPCRRRRSAFSGRREARYVTDLRVSFLRACMLISTRAFDPLPLEARNALLTSSATGMTQLEELGRAAGRAAARRAVRQAGAEDGAGVRGASAPSSSRRRAQARDQLAAPGRLVRPELLQRVLTLLADFRAEHRALEGDKRRAEHALVYIRAPARSFACIVAAASARGAAAAQTDAHGDGGARRHGVGARGPHRSSATSTSSPTARCASSGTSAASPATSCRCSSASSASSSTASPRRYAVHAAAPSMRVMRVLGLFQSRDESLRARAAQGDVRRGVPQAGFVNLGRGGHRARRDLLAQADPPIAEAKATAVDLGSRRPLGRG